MNITLVFSINLNLIPLAVLEINSKRTKLSYYIEWNPKHDTVRRMKNTSSSIKSVETVVFMIEIGIIKQRVLTTVAALLL